MSFPALCERARNAPQQFSNVITMILLWHKKLKGGLSPFEKQRILRKAPSRLRKTTFRVREIDLILLDAKKLRGLSSFQKGFRNSDGSPRNAKLLLDLESVCPIRIMRF